MKFIDKFETEAKLAAVINGLQMPHVALCADTEKVYIWDAEHTIEVQDHEPFICIMPPQKKTTGGIGGINKGDTGLTPGKL